MASKYRPVDGDLDDDKQCNHSVMVPDWLYQMISEAALNLPTTNPVRGDYNLHHVCESLFNDRTVRLVLESAIQRSAQRVMQEHRQELLRQADELQRRADELRGYANDDDTDEPTEEEDIDAV